jgi:TLC ATP/ADP transporter
MRLFSIVGILQVSVFVIHLHPVSSLLDRSRVLCNDRILPPAHGVKSLIQSPQPTLPKGRVNLVDSFILHTRGGETESSTMTTATSSNAEEEKMSPLAKLRQTVFPIYGEEVKKFFLISSIKFHIILALTLTRDTKDTLVVTQCGAEAIAFLKVSQKPVAANFSSSPHLPPFQSWSPIF